jgi:fumarate hydratase class II
MRGDLASKIADLFNIPLKSLSSTKPKDAVTLTNKQELQGFYKSLDQSSEEIKFVVQDLQTPDGESAFS